MHGPNEAPGEPTPDPGVLLVLIVDDQQLVRSGFSMILSVEDDIEVVGMAEDGERGVAMARQLRPDVILMDVQMPVMDGIEATRRIVADDLSRVLILTTFDRDDYLFDGLAAGASGFLLKNADPEDLVDAVRAVAAGNALLAPEVTMRVIRAMTTQPGPGTGGGTTGSAPAGGGPADSAFAGGQFASGSQSGGAPAGGCRSAGEAQALARLTDREREVLGLVARGMSNAEIASELFLGEATVKTHVSNTLAKLHLRDRVQAVVFAYENGLTHS